MKPANRMLTIVVFGLFVTVGWSLLSHTEWAAAREYLGAGLDFDSSSDPLVVFGTMTAVAVAGTKLVEGVTSRQSPVARHPKKSPVPGRQAARTPTWPDAA